MRAHNPRRIILRLTVTLVVTLSAGPLRAGFRPEAWRFYRPAEVPEGARGEHARIPLDPHVWDHAAGPVLQDLRVVRGTAEEIGYAVYVPERPTPRRKKRPARVLNVARRGHEASQLLLDLGEDPPPTNGIRIETLAENFRCPVTVEVSHDRQDWWTVREDAAIFAFSGEVSRRFTEVSFPDATFRYLRIVVGAPPGGEPIELAGAMVWQEVEPEPPEVPLLVPRPVASRTESAGTDETRHVLDLGARNLPVSRIAFETNEENFWRPVRIDISDDRKAWHAAGDGIIFRYRTAAYRREQVTVDFDEMFGRYLRVIVRDRDDPALAVTGIAVEGRPRYIFFPFEQGRRYRLFYGNPDARPGRYDYRKVFAHVARRQAVEARLGPVRRNTRFIATREARPPDPWLVRNQWVLYAATAAVVAALVLIALRALRRPAPEEPAAGG